MKNFEYGRPASIEQARAFLGKGAPGVFLMGGGTDLLGEIKEGIVAPAVVLDLKAIPGLAGIKKEKDALVIGAAATIADVAASAEIAAALPGPAPGRRRRLFPPIADHGHGRRQSLPAAALLVLPGRLRPLHKKGRIEMLSPRKGGTSTMRSSPEDSAGRSFPPTWPRR